MKQQTETIHFYHTNDIHSHFDNWPTISRFLCEQKRLHAERGEACFVFDIGDFVDRSHPFTEGTMGKGNVHLLNEAGYDAVTIGNNEGITMSKADLNALYADAEFDIVLANVHDDDGQIPSWASAYKIYNTANGIKIGVIGATAHYSVFYSKLGWQIDPPREALKRHAEYLKGKTDLIVCLSHMGIHEDEQLAVECDGLDFLFGGHTHHRFNEGKFVNNTLLAATGKFGEAIGHVTIEIDMSTKEIIEKKASLIRVEQFERSEEDIQKSNELIEIGKKLMDEEIFYSKSDLTQNLFGPSPLSSFFGRALTAYTEADCAIFNAGIFLGSLSEGRVTKGDLHEILPHPINPCVVTLDGAELMKVYNDSLNEDWPKTEVKGLGFRGTLMGAMIHERLFENRNGQLFAGNREVVAGQTYKLATLDMFTFGYFFPTLKDAPKDYFMPEFLRDVIGWYGKKQNEEV